MAPVGEALVVAKGRKRLPVSEGRRMYRFGCFLRDARRY